jgi:hypothetical protein
VDGFLLERSLDNSHLERDDDGMRPPFFKVKQEARKCRFRI